MKKDVSIAVLTFVVIAAVCYALATLRPKSTPAATESVAATPVASDKVIIRVNGEPITEKEFKLFLEQAPAQQRAFYETPEGREALASEMAKLKMLEQEGRRLGVDKDPEVLDRIKLARSNMVAGYTLRKLVSPPTEARVQQEYEKEKKNLETVELKHIVIAYQGSRFPPRSGAPPSIEVALNKARGILRQIRNGASFENLAGSQSDDPNTARQGGLIGPVSPGSMPPELDAVAMNLKAGQVSEPVRSEFGIHIFKAGERKAAEMDLQMKQGITAMIQRKDVEAAVDDLQKKAKIDLDEQYFGKKTLGAVQAQPPQRRPGT